FVELFVTDVVFFFSSRRRHTRSLRDWSSDVCSSDLAIYNAVLIEAEQKGVKVRLTGEVQAQLGGGRVRCIALGSTDGMVRGMARSEERRVGKECRTRRWLASVS